MYNIYNITRLSMCINVNNVIIHNHYYHHHHYYYPHYGLHHYVSKHSAIVSSIPLQYWEHYHYLHCYYRHYILLSVYWSENIDLISAFLLSILRRNSIKLFYFIKKIYIEIQTILLQYCRDKYTCIIINI